MGGWPSVFYVIGLGGLVWFILWTFFMYDSPAKHPRISPEERHYIEMSIGTSEARVIIEQWTFNLRFKKRIISQFI